MQPKNLLRIIKKYGVSFPFQPHLLLRLRHPYAYIASETKIRYDSVKDIYIGRGGGELTIILQYFVYPRIKSVRIPNCISEKELT